MYKGFSSGMLGFGGPAYVEPFYKPFKTMAFEDALKMSTAAMDKVWTKWELTTSQN
jgi:hypothetical protein